MSRYTEEFYRRQREGARRSAKEIVPLVLELVRPQSIVDVGCGVGAWLAVFKEHGVEDVCGIDGEYVLPSLLEIPKEQFISANLSERVHLDRRFDLVVSLEVAEHLPEASAGTFVESLTSLGDVVLFSAAIPCQGGTGHVNEQWSEYWVRRFAEYRYVVIDGVRRAIWGNENVEWWYAQNTLIFATPPALERSPALRRAHELTVASQLSVVHPRKYREMADWLLRLRRMAADMAAVIPPADSVIFVGDEECRTILAGGRRLLPFVERDGEYWGPPADDATAVSELERLRYGGAKFMVFTQPAFWWFDHYAAFHRHLRTAFRCSLHNDEIVVFDLRRSPHSVEPG